MLALEAERRTAGHKELHNQKLVERLTSIEASLADVRSASLAQTQRVEPPSTVGGMSDTSRRLKEEVEESKPKRLRWPRLCSVQ